MNEHQMQHQAAAQAHERAAAAMEAEGRATANMDITAEQMQAATELSWETYQATSLATNTAPRLADHARLVQDMVDANGRDQYTLIPAAHRAFARAHRNADPVLNTHVSGWINRSADDDDIQLEAIVVGLNMEATKAESAKKMLGQIVEWTGEDIETARSDLIEEWTQVTGLVQ